MTTTSTLTTAALTPEARVLTDRYEFVTELGRGGMGIVYLARDRASDRLVAIKLLSALHAGNVEAVLRFAREARTVAALDHPNIVRTLGIEALSGNAVAIVSEYIPGRTLRLLLNESGQLPPNRTASLLRDVAAALAHAHRFRIVHRDVKPENILIEASSRRALLADFGIARPIDSEVQLTSDGSSLGTPSYMAPEQVKGRAVDERADVYSLGLVGWEMLAGVRPWEGDSLYDVLHKQQHERLPSLGELRPDLPIYLLSAIEGAIAKAPGDRWANGEEFLARLTPTPATLPQRREREGDTPADNATVPIVRVPAANASSAPALREVALPTIVLPEVSAPALVSSDAASRAIVSPEVAAPATVLPDVAPPVTGSPHLVPMAKVLPEVASPTMVSPDIAPPYVGSRAVASPELTSREVAPPVVTIPEPRARATPNRVPVVTESDAQASAPPRAPFATPIDALRKSRYQRPLAAAAILVVALLAIAAVQQIVHRRGASADTDAHGRSTGPSAIARALAPHDSTSKVPPDTSPEGALTPAPSPNVVAQKPAEARRAKLASDIPGAPAPLRSDSPRSARPDTPRASAPSRSVPHAVGAPTAARAPTPTSTSSADGTIDNSAESTTEALCRTATNSAQRTCLNSAIDRNDAALTRVYQALITQLRRAAGGAKEPPEVQALRAQQRAWIDQRDRACTPSANSPSGTLWGAERVPCFARMSESRAALLRARLQRDSPER